MSSQPIKLGIIGCGKQAPKHISGLRRCPGVEIVVADLRPELAKSLADREEIAWVSSPDELFADPGIEGIDICTPTTSHISLAERSVESGKDFFCEKPLCTRSSDSLRLQKLVVQHQRIGMVGYVYRFCPMFELGKSLFSDATNPCDSLVLGRTLTAWFRLGGRGSHQVWKHKKSAGGGALNEMLVHMIDLAHWYFGPADSVEVVCKKLLLSDRKIQDTMFHVDAEDYVVVRMTMKCGVEVLCQADLVTPAFTQVVEIQGENGTFMGSIQQEFSSFLYLAEARAGYQSGRTDLRLGRKNLFEAQMAEFVQAIRTRRQPSRCTVADSVMLLETMEKLSTCHDATLQPDV